MRSVQKVSSRVMWKIETFTEEDTRQETLYMGQWCLSPLQIRHLGSSHISPNHHQLPCDIFLNLINGLKSLPFQSLPFSVLGKARSHRAPNLGCRETESPEWFNVSPKNSAQGAMHEWVHCCDEAANHQLVTAVDFWIIQIVSGEECSCLMQN